MAASQLAGWTLVFVFDTRDRVLLLRRSMRKKILPGVVNGIGGKIEPSDPSPQAAARRELFEESGLLADNLHLAGSIIVHRRRDRQVQERAVIYLFSTREFEGRLKTTCDEGELFWCPIKEVGEHPTTEEFKLYWPRLLSPAGVVHVWTEYVDDQPTLYMV